MTTQIAQNVQVRNAGRGRPTSDKTVKVRRSVLNAVLNAEGNVTFEDIARATKLKRSDVNLAMKWLEKQGVVVRAGSVAHRKNRDGKGRGRPMIAWSIA